MSAVNVVLGLWLVAAPFALGYDDATTSTINSIIVGLVVAGLALLRLLRPDTITWPGWLNVALGFWLLGTPWYLGDGDRGWLIANNWLVGWAVIVLAIWSGVSSIQPEQSHHEYQEMT